MNAKLIKKIDMKTTELEKNVEKLKLISPKFKGVAILIGVTMAVGLAFGGFMAVSKWYDENQVSFQTPVIFQSPVVIKRRESAKIHSPVALQGQVLAKEVSPHVKTEFETVMGQKHGSILWNIYQLETQRGKTDHCRITGKGFGGFGVMYAGEIMCYPTFEKAVERAEFWLSKMEPDKNLVGALCLWNTGVADQVNCNYYQSYLSL